MYASSLPSRGHRRGRKCYVTPSYSGVPNAKRAEKIRSACLTPASSETNKRAEVLHYPTLSGVPNARREQKIRTAYLNPAS